MSEYIIGTTNQGELIGTAGYTADENAIMTNSINGILLNESQLIDKTSIITNSSNELSVNPSLSLTSLSASGNISADNLIASGYVWAKGKNRVYEQNLTASTTTSTTAVLLGTALSITPEFSGYIIVDAVLRINNNTVGDGVTVSLLNGTTVLDSETYTQEGLASNGHTLHLHYELSNQTIGTALSLSLNFNAITGGTASAKIVKFTAEEI